MNNCTVTMVRKVLATVLCPLQFAMLKPIPTDLGGVWTGLTYYVPHRGATTSCAISLLICTPMKNKLLRRHLRNVSYDNSLLPTGNTCFRSHPWLTCIMSGAWSNATSTSGCTSSPSTWSTTLEGKLVPPSAALFTLAVYYSPNVTCCALGTMFSNIHRPKLSINHSTGLHCRYAMLQARGLWFVGMG